MNPIREIDFNDIQGLIRFAHGHLSESCFLLLEVTDAVLARSWLAAAPITTAANADPLPNRALQVAFSASGLAALGLPEDVIAEFSDEFVAGMSSDQNRSRRLGDVGTNSPAKWAWGGSAARRPDLVLMLYAVPGELEAWQEQVQRGTFGRAFETQTRLRNTARGPHEPFGFVDGISQPKIDWQGVVSTDRHERDRYSNLLALGEIVLGYPNEYGLYTTRPLLDPRNDTRAQQLPEAEDDPALRDLGRNGTYVVMRQLAQDVPAFWQYMDRAAESKPEERERLAALVVGRELDGTPLMDRSVEPIPGLDPNSNHARMNQFTYDDDPHGYTCPVGAHVRRSNPRTGDYPVGVRGLISRLVRTFGFGRRHALDDLVASARFHRILRRGRVYGSSMSLEEALETGTDAKADANGNERGLQFIALGANISRQFEFVQNAWSVSAKFAGLPSESDPLLGNREPLLNGDTSDDFSIPQGQGPKRCLKSLPQFVAVRGGAYLFMPGIEALRYISGSTSTSTTE